MSEKSRLFLILPNLAELADIPSALSQTLSAGDVACLLVKTSAKDSARGKQIVQMINEIAQPLGCAVLLEGDKNLVLRSNSDGLHFPRGPDPDLNDALKSLQPAHIVGVGGLKNRDDAMKAGEAGVDYLMFGEPTADGFVPPVSQTMERAQWWVDIFNVPCVAYAHQLPDVAALSGIGADFIALGQAVWSHPDGPAVAVRQAQSMLQLLPPR